jgi:precorrin-6A/cobalt-precorrin-6A reductase
MKHLMPKSVLILGGTGDARNLADKLVDTYGDDLRVITSLAGRTTSPRQPKGAIREGGFGGAEGLAKYLKETKIKAVIDATHPYAAQISKHGIEACQSIGIPYVLFDRPAWVQDPDENWLHVPDMAGAADAIETTSTAMITTGIQNLDAFKNVHGPKILVRLLEHPKTELPIEDAEIVIGRPPYSLNDEVTLFKLLGVDTLVTKNAGGDATRAKIDAARVLGIHVIMIDRPATPPANTVTNIDEAVSWIASELALSAR